MKDSTLLLWLAVGLGVWYLWRRNIGVIATTGPIYGGILPMPGPGDDVPAGWQPGDVLDVPASWLDPRQY